MNSTPSRRRMRLPEERTGDNSTRWVSIRETFSIVFKFSGLILWFFVFLLAILELKRYYNIDVISNYDSSVDDMYGALKGSISEFFGGED